MPSVVNCISVAADALAPACIKGFGLTLKRASRVLEILKCFAHPKLFCYDVRREFCLLKKMEERRKIVIPTGVDPEETLARHYFDTEATLAARPVVPLTNEEAAQAATPVVKPAGRNRWLLPAVIVGAVAVGLVVGLGISVYRSRQSQPVDAPVAVRPISDKTRDNSLPWTYTPEEPVAAEDETATVADADETTTTREVHPRETEPRAVEETDRKRAREAPARDEREDKQDQIAQQREDERAQRQEERRRRRARDGRNADEDLPQDPIIRHTREGVHRIREIFEGTP